MSDEKIDLAEIARDAEDSRGDYFGVSLDADDVLALVRAVRAMRAYMSKAWHSERILDVTAEIDAVDAALANITDSAEVRSDGE